MGILTDILLAEKGVILHMLLTEYDEKKHLKHTFEEGREDLLRELIQKKISKGKPISEIAEELETNASVIERIISKQ